MSEQEAMMPAPDDWTVTYEPKPGRLRGSVWWCEDTWCDCTQARIERIEHKGTAWYTHTLLWEGTFYTDGESGATTELNREARRLRRQHHDIYTQIEWPWDRKNHSVPTSPNAETPGRSPQD